MKHSHVQRPGTRSGPLQLCELEQVEQFLSRVDSGLFVDVTHMAAYGMRRNDQLVRNVSERSPACQVLKHLCLTARQPVHLDDCPDFAVGQLLRAPLERARIFLGFFRLHR